MISIYTDGSCKSKRGGWAALVTGPDERKILSGKAVDTTSNRMEIMAAISALESLPVGSQVALHSDSEYLVKTMTKGWRRNVNLDLWQRLDAVANEHTITWEWVKGHDGIPPNEFVNALAEFEAGVRSERPKLERYLSAPAGDAEPADSEEPRLTHLDEEGRASMVDVGWKPETTREAVARGWVSMQPETMALIRSGGVEKGDVLSVARIAGVMAAKRTSDLIPLCHPLPLDQVRVELDLDEVDSRVVIAATARTTAKTGVEMEALTAVSVAALTVYDMCKAVDRGMRIEGVRLARKSGGQSGDIVLEE